ncbi:MAG: hypothetical protein ACR2M4_00650 [Actinomycetota bacterium]
MLGRFDGATVEGLSDAGFIELDRNTPEQAATLILERLALNEGKPKNHYTESAITDPQHSERLHPKPYAFDHLSQDQQWYDLSAKVIEDFLGKQRVQIQEDFLVGLKPIEQFRRFKFIRDDGHVRNGAHLCFGDSPSDVIPGATTKCFHWKGVNQLTGFLDDLDSRNGLLQQFEATLGFLKRTLRLERQITEEGRAEVLEIPLDVLEEAVANALVHRE